MNRILCFLFTAMLCAAVNEPTSTTNANLQKILKRYPTADANKDGQPIPAYRGVSDFWVKKLTGK